MSWYYEQEGQSAGPVEGHELYRLVHSGRLSGDTPVRRDNEQNWKPFRDYFPLTTSAPALPDRKGDLPPAIPPPADPVAENLIACTLCGKRHPDDDLLEFASVRICAECKPRYFQELREGVARMDASADSLLRYGGFWIRTAAFALDVILIYLVSKYAIVPALSRSGLRGRAFVLSNAALQLAFQMAYFTVFHALYGATPGKRLLRLRVVNPDGTRIGWLTAFVRYFAQFLSRLIAGIGCMMAAFDDEKRALHDRLCNTRVIRVAGNDSSASAPSPGIPPRGNDFTSPVI